METKALKNYIKAVSSLTVCDKKTKDTLLGDLKARVGEYTDENSNATMADISARFGTPEEIADTFAQSIPPETIKQIRHKKRVLTTVLAAILAVFAFVLIYSAVSSEPAEDYHYNVVVSEGAASEVTGESAESPAA